MVRGMPIDGDTVRVVVEGKYERCQVGGARDDFYIEKNTYINPEHDWVKSVEVIKPAPPKAPLSGVVLIRSPSAVTTVYQRFGDGQWKATNHGDPKFLCWATLWEYWSSRGWQIFELNSGALIT